MAALRFGRGRKDKPKRKLLIGVRPLPTMVTLGNLLCGFGAIFLAMRSYAPPPGMSPAECLNLGGLLIFGGMIFDVMDGQVARWTKSTSKFGMEMDSLCDVVTFGLAPAVLVKGLIDLEKSHPNPPDFPLLDRYVYLLMAVYVCCAALRLARYNVESDTGHRDFFFGMPSPGAAGCVASLVVMLTVPSDSPKQVILIDQLQDPRIRLGMLIFLPFLMLCLGILMVSRVHYAHLGDRLLRGKKSFMHILVLGLILVLIIMQHEFMLALAFNGYMLFGVLNELRFLLIPSSRPPEWDVRADQVPGEIKSSGSSGGVPKATVPVPEPPPAAQEVTAPPPATPPPAV